MAREVVIKLKADAAGVGQGVDQAKRKLGELDDVGRGTVSTFGDLRGGIAGAVAAFGVMEIAGALGDLRLMGQNAQYAYERFENLAGGPALVEEAIRDLRQNTGGTILDPELMEMANTAILTGVADTMTEAGDIIQTGLQLGGEEGAKLLLQSLKNGIGSIELLDSVGINAARVRELTAQYRAAGEDANSAYTRAVLEAAEATRDALGDSIDAAFTNWDRLETHILNGVGRIGAGVNSVFEDLSGYILDIIEPDQDLSTGATVNLPAGTAPQLARNPMLLGPGKGQLGYDVALEFLQDRLEAWWQSGEMQRNMNRSLSAIEDPFNELSVMAQGFNAFAPQRGSIGEQFLFTNDDLRRSEEIQHRLESVYEMARNNPDLISEDELANAERMAEQGREWRDYVRAGVEAAESMTMPELFGQEVTNPLLAGLGGSFLDRMSGTLEDSELQALEDAIMLRTGEQTPESLAWRDQGLVALEAIYEQYGRDSALAALEAYERGAREADISGNALPDPVTAMGYVNMGGGDGGGYTVNPGDGHDAVARGLGMSRDELYARGILRPDQMIHAGQQYGGGMNLQPFQMDGWTPYGMGAIGSSTGFGAGPAGEAPDLTTTENSMKGIAESTAKTATSAAIWSDSVGSVGGALSGAVGGTGKLSGNMDNITDKALTFKTYIEDLTKKVNVVRLKMDVDDRNIPQWMNDWLKAGLAQVVSENGGTVPGTDSRASGGRSIPK